MQIKFNSLSSIKDVIIVEPEIYRDNSGFFLRHIKRIYFITQE